MTDTDLDNSYYDKLAQLESGGRNIGSATSSATGPFQILGGTWENIRKQHPELELTSQDRYDPQKQQPAVRAFTQDNVRSLKDAGITPTGTNTYFAHFLGAGGATKFIQGYADNPDAPAIQYASPAAVAANQNVFYKKDGTPKTLDEVYNHVDQTFNGTAPGFNDLMSQYRTHMDDMKQRYGGQNQPQQVRAAQSPFVNTGARDPRTALLLGMMNPYPMPGQQPQPQQNSYSPSTMNYLNLILQAQRPSAYGNNII